MNIDASIAEEQNLEELDFATIDQASRMVEALLFASADPVAEKHLAERIDEGLSIDDVMAHLKNLYQTRGVNLVRVGEAWAFRTADDLSYLLQQDSVELKKLTKAALEVLAITAYHQPVTRAEIEEIRGVSTSKGTLDNLLETGWLRMRGRRKSPGKPVTYGTTTEFLDHFGLEEIKDLPGMDELKGAGLLQSQVPVNFAVPMPNDQSELTPDEDPLDDEEFDFGMLSPMDIDDEPFMEPNAADNDQ